MGNPFSWDELTTMPLPSEVFTPSAVVFLVLFSIGFIAATYAYNTGARPLFRHRLSRPTVQRGAGIAMTVFGFGLFFFAIRLLQINPFTFGLPIWLWLCVLALIVMTVSFVYAGRRINRGERAANRQQRRSPLAPAAADATAASTASRPVPPSNRRPVKVKRRRR